MPETKTTLVIYGFCMKGICSTHGILGRKPLSQLSLTLNILRSIKKLFVTAASFFFFIRSEYKPILQSFWKVYCWLLVIVKLKFNRQVIIQNFHSGMQHIFMIRCIAETCKLPQHMLMHVMCISALQCHSF